MGERIDQLAPCPDYPHEESALSYGLQCSYTDGSDRLSGHPDSFPDSVNSFGVNIGVDEGNASLGNESYCGGIPYLLCLRHLSHGPNTWPY